MKRMYMRLAVLGATLGVVLAAAPSVGAQTPNCVVRTNIEAIIDDSGSMSSTDFDRVRVAGMNLLIDKNPQRTLGAVEFGSDAGTVFLPAQIGPNAAGMKGALDTLIQADGGTTNYNAAFDRANAENPGAHARIFLTDGGHNEGDYLEGHRNGGAPPTYVIELGSFIDQVARDRLARIAAETGGRFFEQVDLSRIQAVFNTINAHLDCLNPPKTWTDTFQRVGQQKRHTLVIPRNFARDIPVLGRPPRMVELVTSWTVASSRFTIPRKSIQIVRNGKVVASKGLRVRRVNGETFAIVRISRLVRGKLVFKVKAVRLSSGFFASNPNTAVTQASLRK